MCQLVTKRGVFLVFSFCFIFMFFYMIFLLSPEPLHNLIMEMEVRTTHAGLKKPAWVRIYKT